MHAELTRYLLAPRAMAIVGASERNPYSRSALTRLEQCGYQGQVYLVNPGSATVWGQPAYPRANALPGPIDMAFIVVPRTAVLQALQDCAAGGARAAVVISNGFGESADPLGRELQNQLEAFLRATPMALCGPSCLGVLNLGHDFQAFGGHPGVPLLKGGLALVSQSGANVHSYIGTALARNLGFNYIVSSGNEVGLELADYIDYFLDDPATRAVCAYVESVRTPARFVAVARRARDLGKPIIVIKIGRSESAHRAALAHTGAMTGPDELFNTLFRQYGVIRADSIEEALDRAALFVASAPARWPRAPGVGLVSISGGFAAALADVSDAAGFAVPEFAPATNARLAEILPPNVSAHNPIDISTQAQRDRPDAWEQALHAVAADPAVDLVLDAEALPVDERRVRVLLAVRERSGKPVLLATTSPHIDIFSAEIRALCHAGELPLLAGVDGTRRALQSVLAYTRQQEAGTRPAPATLPAVPRPPQAVLHEVAARALLAPFGIRGPAEAVADDAAAVAEAARRLGAGRFALKVISSQLPHRSEHGLIRLNVAPAQLAEECAVLERNLAATGVARDQCRLLVQTMTPGVAELIVGLTCTPGYPPLLMVGFGGVNVELLKDVATRVCPIDATEAAAMLRELRLFPTLTGYRGRTPGDVAALARAIAAMSDFAMAAGDWLREAELNPLIVLPAGQGVLAVDALIVARP